MKKNIALYCDEGVGAFSLFCTRDYFSDHNIKFLKASDIIRDGITSDIDMFVMPGGADKPYAKKLNGKGNENIRHYVEQGGTYLGICAGAYYGCSTIEFQKGTAEEICEDRELGFFQGKAIGCITDITKPYDLTLKSAAVTALDHAEKNVFYWGGCHFGAKITSNVKVRARYNKVPNNPAAIIETTVGQGRAILSGVHFEVSAQNLKEYDFENSLDNQLKTALSKQLDNQNRFELDDLINQTKKEAA